MASEVFRVIWMTFWLTVVTAATLKKEPDLPGRKFFKGIPEPERLDYLSFELSRGYTMKTSRRSYMSFDDEIIFPDALDLAEEVVRRFEALQIPDNFTQNLFDFVQTEFELDNVSIRTLILSHEICFENGECIDLNDVGALCCPF